jgi:ParB family chromosome partitioning protein
MTKKRGLGRGLDALLGIKPAQKTADANSTDVTDSAATNAPNAITNGVVGNTDNVMKELPVDIIQRGKYQPRRDMDQDALQELAESIKAQGVMQPIIVRPIGEGRYEIIAGERRWRATQLAGLHNVPVVIRDVPDEAAIAMALIENIQRENLNAMEEAIALTRLQKEFDLTHQQIADAVGKSRVTISNLLRLTSLREDVQKLLEHGDIELGHAKVLLSLPRDEQFSAAQQIIARSLSVRQTESLVRHLLADDKVSSKTTPQNNDADIRRLQDELSEKIGVPVIIDHSAKGKGRVTLKYNSLDELDGILAHIK